VDIWWIDSPHVLGSENPTTADLQQLRREGFEVLISLLREQEQTPRYDVARVKELGFIRHNIPVRDFNPPTIEQLSEFIRLVEQLPGGTKIVIHCQAGMGRTGTFAAAYWIAKGLDVVEAIAKIRKARVYAIETIEQEAVLTEFAIRNASRPDRTAARHKK
jgi:atypical dual specificity phosphatase